MFKVRRYPPFSFVYSLFSLSPLTRLQRISDEKYLGGIQGRILGLRPAFLMAALVRISKGSKKGTCRSSGPIASGTSVQPAIIP
jgi:hypothetical protein